MTQTFLGIKFWKESAIRLLLEADEKGGLLTVPSAPSLAQMRTDPALERSYRGSDFAVVDGGYVALVLRLVFQKNLPRISGLQILERLIGVGVERAIPFHERRVMFVVPSEEERRRIKEYMLKKGFSSEKLFWYEAPFYQGQKDFEDRILLTRINEDKPDWIVLCIAGGKQEKLGLFLRDRSAECRVPSEKRGDVEH